MVFGAGTMGLLLAQLLVAGGAGAVTLVEPNAERRRFATEVCGLTAVDVDYEAAPVPAVIDATGTPAALAAALDAVERGGSLLVFGVAAPDVELAVSPFRIYNQELRIVGSMAIVDSFGRAVEVVAEHDEALRRLVTHHLSLDAFDEALERLRDGTAVKVVLSGAAGNR